LRRRTSIRVTGNRPPTKTGYKPDQVSDTAKAILNRLQYRRRAARERAVRCSKRIAYRISTVHWMFRF
jgi:hypothetical protein